MQAVSYISKYLNFVPAALRWARIEIATPIGTRGWSGAAMVAAQEPPVLTFWERNPPFAALAAAKLSGANIAAKPDPKATKDTVATLTFATGEQLVGLPLILRYAARAGDRPSTLFPSSPLLATQVDYLVDYCIASVVSGSSLEGVLTALNEYLAFRSYLVGYATSLADVALWGQLQASPLWKKHQSSGKLPHLTRWWEHLAAHPECSAAVEELLAMDSKKIKAAASAAAVANACGQVGEATTSKGAGESGSFDIQLPGAEMGKVVTRFPPEPSGYLHIGHAKAALLNQHFADMYQGKLLVRFDDTNPSKEKDEFVENIIKDIKDLGLRFDRITYTSDYFPQLLEVGERLIKAGVLYADDTPVDVMREERMAKKESRCRNRSVAENLAVWEDMKAGNEKGLTAAMRFKIDMQSTNGAMRDPVAFRCNLTHHWRTGHKYKVYPTYDCACPFVDSIEGVTHALRTSEYKDREEQYYWVLKATQAVWPGLPHVNIWDYSRLNFVNTLLSKRKLTWFVESGRVDGWDDPRMPTVQGILRRGMRVEALREFILSQGASKNVTYQEWDKIWTINKKLIDPVCPRHTAVELKGRVPVTLINGPSSEQVVTVPRHKKYPPAGKKAVLQSSSLWLDQVDAKELSEGEEVTLMDWGNAWVRSISKEPETGVVSALSLELHPGGDPKKTRMKLTWLAQSEELVELLLVDFDYLINKRKVEEDDDFMQLVNPTTKFEVPASGDGNMRVLQKGEVIQLERKGYYIVDQPLTKPGKPMVLFCIPDGRTKTMTK